MKQFILNLKENTMNFAGTVTINRNAIISVFLCILLIYAFYNFGSPTNSKRSEYIDLKNVLSVSIDAAKRGGDKVFKIRESATLAEQSKGETQEGANDPVTEGDLQSHIEMLHSIRKAFPNINIISEEKSSGKYNVDAVHPGSLTSPELNGMDIVSKFVNPDDIAIWIDPLDATQEYTENLRQYVTTMVCVAVKGVPTIGVIHKPFENFTAWAWVNNKNSPSLQVSKSNKGEPTEVRIIVSRSHKGQVVEGVEKAFGKSAIITDAGGAGYKTLEVLFGRQDVYVHKTLIKKWDICAGNAILNHFGGTMTTLKGDNIDYGSEVDFKNPGGLVASLENHKFYLQKLKDL